MLTSGYCDYTNQAKYKNWDDKSRKSVHAFSNFGEWCGVVVGCLEANDSRSVSTFLSTNRIDNLIQEPILRQYHRSITNLCSHYILLAMDAEKLKRSELPYGVEAVSLLISLFTVPLTLSIAATKVLAQSNGWIRENEPSHTRNNG